MKPPSRRLVRERKTIRAMVRLYCRDQHGARAGLCDDCSGLLEYALQRLETCPFQEAKPACNLCAVHCYSGGKRERVQAVMRYSGPRMLLPHPWLSLGHLLDKLRPVPRLRRK